MKPSERRIVRVLLRDCGRTFAEELGIDLKTDDASSLFRLLCASMQIGLKGWLDRGLRAFTRNSRFLGDLGAIPQHVLVLAGLWYVCYWLHQRKIFFKI